MLQIRSTKSEIRNKFQAQMSKTTGIQRHFGNWDFGFVSDFVLRISDFGLAHLFKLLLAAPLVKQRLASGADCRVDLIDRLVGVNNDNLPV